MTCFSNVLPAAVTAVTRILTAMTVTQILSRLALQLPLLIMIRSVFRLLQLYI